MLFFLNVIIKKILDGHQLFIQQTIIYQKNTSFCEKKTVLFKEHKQIRPPLFIITTLYVVFIYYGVH